MMNSWRFWNERCRPLLQGGAGKSPTHRVGLHLFAVCLFAAGCGRTPSGVTVADVVLHETTAQDLLKTVRTPGAKVVVVNMWATWCVPCREEFPDLVNLERNYRDHGLRMVLVSWDAEAAVARPFLAKQGVGFPSHLKTSQQGDTKFIEEFEPQWSGAFPATMIYDGAGKLRHFWEGKRSYAEFEEKVLDVLKPNQTGG